MRRQPKKHSVTLKDLAEKTGYSVNTVSRALRGKDDIAESTIEIIKKSAKEMGYINNTIASSLRLGYTNTLAVILGDISNPHFAIMTKEIENRASEYGYTAFLLNTNENSARELQAIKTAINKNVDGIIICPCQETEENIRFLIDSTVPFIQIGRRNEITDTNYVVCDDVQGGYLAASYLIEKGHTKILFLNGPSYISSSRERYKGYQKALEAKGLSIDERLVREVSVSESNLSEVMEKVWTEELDFTAILAFSDSLAWEAWTWLHQKGYRVPEDYSLVGFDHIQSRMQIPFQLTTICSYKAKISVTAIDCLMKKIDPARGKMTGDCDEICHHIISTSLVEGETVREL
ncbi:MAG: LacI family DNA-binding transcriptional regulator [Otoolea sp.]